MTYSGPSKECQVALVNTTGYKVHACMFVHYQVKYMRQGDCRCSHEAESSSKSRALIGVVVYMCAAGL